MTSVRTIIVVAAIALGLAGCGSGGSDDADSTATGSPGDGPTVTVQEIAFQDQTVTVEAGTTVTWDNQDSVAHTVTSGTPDNPSGEFDEELPADGEATVTVDEPGTYEYWCRIHPSMTAELVVE